MKFQAKILNVPDSVETVRSYVNQWHSLAIEDVYMLNQQIEQEHVKEPLSSYNGNIWIVFQIFYDTDNNRFPLAKLNSGRDAIGSGHGSWLKMLCPRGSDSHGISLLEHRSKQIQQSISQFQPKGISLDFIRHFVFWEAVFDDYRSEEFERSCFCHRCTTAFEEYYEITLPIDNTKERATYILDNFSELWDMFTTTTITEFAEQLISAAKEIDESIGVNIHLVPWNNREMDNARTKIAGQDLQQLTPLINQISPMCYSPMLKKSFRWTADLVQDLHTETTLPIWPAIQACSMYDTKPLDDSEFSEMILEAAKAPSAGVVIWPWETITKSQLEQLQTMKQGTLN